VQVLQVDALNWMNQRQRAGHFDLVFLDPPFEADCFAPALAAASHCVAVGGWVYLEADHTFSDEDAAVLCVGLRRHRHGQAGAVHFHLFQRVAKRATPVCPKSENYTADEPQARDPRRSLIDVVAFADCRLSRHF
jgi:hypothetical protein